MNANKSLKIALLSFFFIFFPMAFSPCSPLAIAQGPVKIKEIKIAGNVRVEDDGIRLHLKSQAGEVFDPEVVDQDVKAIYRMGFFDDVRADWSAEGVLTFNVKEKPYVREVKIQGASQVARDKIETALGITPRTILERSKVAEGVEKVRKLYNEQGYVNAKIDYAVSVEPNNQAVVVLDINEGKRLLIKQITFEGNRAFSDSELRGLMATKEEWLFSFITNRGVLDRDILTNDMAILANHYYDNGYIDHKIDEPVILRGREGLELVIRVHEGEQYHVGKVEIGGDFIQDGRQLLKKVKITEGQIFRGSRLRSDIETLTEAYSNKGFAFAKVDPVTKIDPKAKKVDIALMIHKGPPVYFNRVLVAGNTKTRDKVVRRELLATEQELFSGTKITQSRNALQRTGYFEDVQLTTKKTDQPDAVDLLVDVKEGPTGMFTLGAGFSSGDGIIFNSSVAEKNLFGRGQALSGSFAIGSSRQDFLVNFTEPYLNDSRMSLGLDAYNTSREYTDFKERKLGFGVNTSYPLKYLPFFGQPRLASTKGSDYLETEPAPTIWDYMRGGVAYELYRQKISGISSTAPVSIAEEEGSSVTSAVTPNLTYDSRDHFFNPTEGTRSIFSSKFAGLGGDNVFIRNDISGKWYYPLVKDPRWGGAYVLALGGSLGYGVGLKNQNGSSDLPLADRYFIGGINTVRGFADRSIGPRDCDSNGRNCEVIGGDRSAVLNAELMFPVMEQYGLRGDLFFDMGSSFRGSDGFNLNDFRRSIGVGARWMSPFGPLRVELGFPLTKKPYDDTSMLGFSIGNQP